MPSGAARKSVSGIAEMRELVQELAGDRMGERKTERESPLALVAMDDLPGARLGEARDLPAEAARLEEVALGAEDEG